MSITKLPALNRSSATFKADVNTYFGTTLPQFTAELNTEIDRLNTLGTGAYTGTSTTSNTVGTGAKTFTIQAGRGFVVGQPVQVAQTANPATNYMIGLVTSYNSTTGVLVVNVSEVGGSGTFADWTVSVSSVRSSNSVMPGTVIFYAANAAPAGYLKANGAAVSRTTYAGLFAVIGTVFGSGNGTTTFNVPDLRAEFIRGWDDGRAVDSGRAFGSAQADEFKSHIHSYTLGGATGGGYAYQNYQAAGSSTTDAAGGVETRPRNVALLACIKF